MLRLGTAGPWLLSLLCGLACGDRVVVARGLSLVSAAQSSGDAGFGELGFEGLGFDGPLPADAGVADAAAEKPFDFGHQGPNRKPPAPFFPPRADDRGDPHDKDPDEDPSDADPGGAPDDDRKAEKVEKTGEPDAGQARDLTHHNQ